MGADEVGEQGLPIAHGTLAWAAAPDSQAKTGREESKPAWERRRVLSLGLSPRAPRGCIRPAVQEGAELSARQGLLEEVLSLLSWCLPCLV